MEHSIDSIRPIRPKIREIQAKVEGPQEFRLTAYRSNKRILPVIKILRIAVASASTVFLIGLVYNSIAPITYASKNIESTSTPKKTTIIQPAKETKEKETALDAITRVIKKPEVAQVTRRGGFESVYKSAAKKYRIAWELLAAIHYVETGQSGDTDRANASGATGPMQFMPGTFQRYAVDGDSDGTKKISDVDDAIYSAAKNLAANGAGRGQAASALYNYNHSSDYVQRVLAVARGFGYKD